jgi:hypothetical protein
MADIAAVAPVKLFVVTLHRDLSVLEEGMRLLREAWGETDFESPDFPFEETTYYETEMGPGLARRFFSFARLIPPDRIVEAKLFTNSVEDRLKGAMPGRTLNLDPGYLDAYKLVLASAKFGGQKIYLRDGIYADMTLVRYKKKWESFDWGFPDFKSRKYDVVLSAIRDLYKKQYSPQSHKEHKEEGF